MSTVPASQSKTTTQASPKPASEGRPETLQYEVAKHEAEALAASAGAKAEWARVTPASSPPPPPSSPPPPPPEDPDKWGTSTLVGQQAPVIAKSPASGIDPAITTPAPHGPDVTETLQRGATQLADAVGSGFRAATRSLKESTPGSLEALLPGTPSPELVGGDPVGALSVRLAAESDFWRRLGLRSLSRAVIADRFGYFVAGLTVVSGLGLAVVAALGGLFAGEHAAGKSGLILVGALALLCAGGVSFAFTHAVRRAQRDTAAGAFTRADHAELRLHRLALAVVLRRGDPGAFHEALEHVTDDARA